MYAIASLTLAFLLIATGVSGFHLGRSSVFVPQCTAGISLEAHKTIVDTCMSTLDLAEAVIMVKDRNVAAVVDAYRCKEDPRTCDAGDIGDVAVGGP
jgi:hypothetical protein